MNRVFIYKILVICNLVSIPLVLSIANAQENIDLERTLSEERRILEQLNILKKNNINNDSNNNLNNNALDNAPPQPTLNLKEINVKDLDKESINKKDTNLKNTKATPKPTKVIKIETPTKNDASVSKNIVNKNKNIATPFPQKVITPSNTDISNINTNNTNTNSANTNNANNNNTNNIATNQVLGEQNFKENDCIKENKQLELANQKIIELTSELENKKRQLILVETEVERLSEIIEKRNRAQLGSATNNRPSTTTQSIPDKQKQISDIRKSLSEIDAERADMPIIVVNVSKANLRAGPSLRDSPLLEVSKGTRLVVETRQGSWYRVIAPNGKRAWVSSDVVDFGPTSSSRPSYTTRIKGYNQDVEDRTESIFR
ncbi:MAG: SH3 domain-containing protein [Bdellovibrionota bacterium]